MLFYATGFAFWVIFGIALVCLIVSMVTESSWWGLTVIICFFGALWFFGYKENVSGSLKWLRENPMTLIVYSLAYVLIGVGYSFVKWYYFLLHEKTRVKKASQIAYHRDALFNWIFYWPLWMLWDLIHNPFTKLFNFIYNNISGSYQRMADKMFTDYQKPPERGDSM